MKRNTTLLQTLIVLVLSIVVSGGAVMAWFSLNNSKSTDDIGLNVNQAKDGIVINKINGETATSDSFYLLPGEFIDFEITLTAQTDNFGFTADVIKPDFNSTFTNRSDLTIGEYKIQKIVYSDSSRTTSEAILYDFDIEDAFVERGLTDEQKNALRLAFFKKFFDNNILYSAMSATIIKVNTENTAYELTRNNNRFSSSTLFMAGQTLTIRVYYDNDDFQPSMTYVTSETNGEYFAPTGETTYKSMNYNCFISQNVNITFVVE